MIEHMPRLIRFWILFRNYIYFIFLKEPMDRCATGLIFARVRVKKSLCMQL